MPFVRYLTSAWLIALGFAPLVALAEVTVEKSDKGAVVKIDGELFTEYLIKSGNKPVLWPIVGPGGKRVTRGFPIEPAKGETTDHQWQRGLWFTHGGVNGVTFWEDTKGTGEEVHREFTKLESGKTGTIAAKIDWLSPKGQKILSEERSYVFGGDGDSRWIDIEMKLIAGDEDVKFKDDKEGSFGIRIADSMRVEAKPAGGIVNSRGQTDKNAWGKPAEWVDCFGPVDGEVQGVAMLQHPSSFRFPTRWHVRGYGLFAANPFSVKAFDAKQEDASFTLEAGKSITLKFRVIFHRGNQEAGKIADKFTEYSKS